MGTEGHDGLQLAAAGDDEVDEDVDDDLRDAEDAENNNLALLACHAPTASAKQDAYKALMKRLWPSMVRWAWLTGAPRERAAEPAAAACQGAWSALRTY